MPITVIASEGVFSETAERQLFADLTESLLRHHDLIGNAFLSPHVIGEVSVIPKGRSYAGGKPADIVVVELKLPSFTLGTGAQKESFIADATEAVLRASGGRHDRDRVYVNVVHAVDGLWGIGGRAYSNEALMAAVAAA